jgi:diaminopimelate decarboxylase
MNCIKQKCADISYGLRVNPGYSEIETDLYNPASPNSRLGIPRNLFPINCLMELMEFIFMHCVKTHRTH